MMKKKLTLKEIQDQEKQMLEILIKFLDNHNINYYLCYGSLLGAVRHKGFIPWDDDIDIVLFRDEYEILINKIKNKETIAGEFEFIGWEIGKTEWPFLKMINKNILVNTESKCDEYLWIDIFPLDKIETNDLKFRRKIRKYRSLLDLKRFSKRNVPISGDTKAKKILKYIISKTILPLLNENFIIKRYINLCKKYNNEKCDYVFNNIWEADYMNKIPIKVLAQQDYYKFEDIKVKSFKDYDTVLKACYGNDYMTPPPIEKRVTHEIKAYKTK